MLPPLQWSLSLSASPKHPDLWIWARSSVTRRGGLSAERGMSAAERRSLSVSGLVKTKSRKILKDTGNYLKLIKRDIWVLTWFIDYVTKAFIKLTSPPSCQRKEHYFKATSAPWTDNKSKQKPLFLRENCCTSIELYKHWAVQALSCTSIELY